jgi:hypothetical protein
MRVKSMLEITPQNVLDILKDTEVAYDLTNCHDAVLVCEEMPVFRIKDGNVEQACTRTSHGVHRSYKKALRALEELVGKIEQEECPDCGGSGWLPVETQGAVRNRVLSVICGVFRGIQLPRKADCLTAEELVANLKGQFADLSPL